ncbi:MAG: NADH-quinone oxidoreductase subunit NuoK [Mariprofundales bacterium]|nr:NADH-quinone oxidoreductase subunit NuoK [Mariprofundales bacterium]
MMVPLSHYLLIGAALFSIGIVGLFLNRKNVITILMCIELILLAVNINFVAFSHFLNDLGGQIFVFFVLTIAASEVAVGLAILMAFYRLRRSINVEDLNTLQG